MVQTTLFRHALQGKAGVLGVREPAQDRLEIVQRPAIAVVMAVFGQEYTAASLLSDADDLNMRFSSFGEWIVVCPTATPEVLEARLHELVGHTAHVIDQSDGRVLINLSGPNVRRILAKGIGSDLHPSAFSIGLSSNVLCGHISANLARIGEDEFELVVMRSYAASLVEDLRQMGREFSMSAGFAA